MKKLSDEYILVLNMKSKMRICSTHVLDFTLLRIAAPVTLILVFLFSWCRSFVAVHTYYLLFEGNGDFELCVNSHIDTESDSDSRCSQ